MKVEVPPRCFAMYVRRAPAARWPTTRRARVAASTGSPYSASTARFEARFPSSAAAERADKVLAEDVSTVNRRAIRRRAKELCKIHWAAETAYQLIQSQHAAAAG